MTRRILLFALTSTLASVLTSGDSWAIRYNYPGQMCQIDAGHYSNANYNRYGAFNRNTPASKFYCSFPTTGSEAFTYTISYWTNTRVQFWDRSSTENVTCVNYTFFTTDVGVVGGTWSSSGGSSGSGPQESGNISHGLSLPASNVMQANVECSVPAAWYDLSLPYQSGIGGVYVDMTRY